MILVCSYGNLWQKLILFVAIASSFSQKITKLDAKASKPSVFNISLPLKNITMIKTSKVTSISGENLDLITLTTPIPKTIIPASSTGNVTIFLPKPLIENDNKISFSEFKNHAFHSSDAVSLKNEYNNEYNNNENNNDNNNESSNEPLIEPEQSEQPESSNIGNSNTTIENYPCNKVPNPTLTPNLHPKPRFATIQWRRVIFPSGFPQSLQNYGFSDLMSPDYKPFHYRKTVNYGQGSVVPESLPMSVNYYPFMSPVSDYKFSSNKYRNTYTKPKYKRPSVFPDLFARFKKPKARRKPAYSYKPFPITAIQQEMKPITLINDEDNSVYPEDSMAIVSHLAQNTPKKHQLSPLEPNPRRLQREKFN